MEFNNINKKKVLKVKSITNNYKKNRLFQFERSNSNSNFSSISKKTGCFEENIYTQKMNSFSTKISPNNLCFSIQNNVAIRSSIDLSLKDMKEKPDINNICTNINISIDNPNFSINNIENNNKTSSIYEVNEKNNAVNKESEDMKNNLTFISFKGSNIDSESKEKDAKIISSIYADYLANKSNSDIHSENYKYETKLKKFNECLEKNKILQYEFTRGCITGFSAYTYQNEEAINKNKLSININVEKSEDFAVENKNKGKTHLINFFSLFCGDKKDDDDDLTKFLKNNFKDILLEDKDIINNTSKAIKNSFIKCEIKYINYYFKEKYKDIDYTDFYKIQNSSIIIILNIDDIFYIGNIGNMISILSSNLSKKIEYISKGNISQEEYDNNIKKKRKSLYSLFNRNINYVNELNNSKECFNKSKFNNNNHNFLNIVSLNDIYTYEYIRIFPGKKLHDIISIRNNNINTSQPISNKKNNQYFPLNNNSNIKENNFIKDNEKIKNKIYNNEIMKNRRASLGPFFKISKNTSYNPKKNYRNSCAQDNKNNKAQIISISSSYPDIISFRHKKNKHDFIFIGCKIIFEKLSCDKICKSVYDTMKKCIKKHRSFELFLGWVIKDIIKMCITSGIKDNISCLFICFNSIKQLYLKHNIDEIKNVLVPLCLTYTNHNYYEFYNDLLSADFINVDKANNYYDVIENDLNIINEENGELIDILDINEINKKNVENNNNNENINSDSKIKTVKKRCCCFF